MHLVSFRARWWLLLGLLGHWSDVRAQTWYRDTYQGPMSAATFETQAPGGVLKLGPVVVDAYAHGLLSYSSNALLAPVAEEGWELGYGLGFDAVWVAAKEQQLKATGEFVQRHVLSGPGRDRTYLALEPGSALRYTVYLKDIRISPFLSASRQLDPVAAPTVTNTATFKQTSFDLGVQVDWPLHHTTLQFMGLTGHKTTGGESVSRARTDRELLSARALRTFSATLDVGVDAFFIDQSYDNGPAASSTQFNASLFNRWALSPNSQLKAAVGLNRYDFDAPARPGDDPAATGWFGEIQLAQRLRPNFNYTVRLVRTQSDGVTSNYYETREISLRPVLTLNDRTNLRLEAGWLRVVESDVAGETGRRTNLGAELEISLPGRWLCRAGIRDLHKSSTVAARAYRQRTVELSLRKQF